MFAIRWLSYCCMNLPRSHNWCLPVGQHTSFVCWSVADTPRVPPMTHKWQDNSLVLLCFFNHAEPFEKSRLQFVMTFSLSVISCQGAGYRPNLLQRRLESNYIWRSGHICESGHVLGIAMSFITLLSSRLSLWSAGMHCPGWWLSHWRQWWLHWAAINVSWTCEFSGGWTVCCLHHRCDRRLEK